MPIRILPPVNLIRKGLLRKSVHEIDSLDTVENKKKYSSEILKKIIFISSLFCKLIFSSIISALLQHKENFKELDAAESSRLVRGQKDHLDYEIRKFRRRRLVKYHDLEQDLLREVSSSLHFTVLPLCSLKIKFPHPNFLTVIHFLFQ